MGPKKQAKKEVVEEPPKQEEPPIPQHQLHGFGRFEYVNGTIYEGNWRLFDGIKMKHGQGVLKILGTVSNNIGSEGYKGSWNQDKMDGFGVYNYPCGASYSGEWKNNKHHGKGVYQFANGTLYQGQWRDHLMHGTGFYIDNSGRKWQGEFRNGNFENKRQKQLIEEKQVRIRMLEAKVQAENTLNSMVDALAKSDKKTFKENFLPFFPAGQTIKGYVKEPFAKLDQRNLDKWTDLLNYLKSGKITVLQSKAESKYLGEQRILAAQLQGPGQVVQVIKAAEERTSKCALVNTEGKTWILVAISDQQKKK